MVFIHIHTHQYYTGTSVDIMRAGVQCAKHVIGHINSRMPRTLGDGLVHISQFDRVYRCVSQLFISTSDIDAIVCIHTCTAH